MPGRTATTTASLRLLELEHELVGRLGRRLRSEIVGVFGMAPEIALAHEFEAGRLDLAAQEALLDAVERTPYRGARAGGGGMVRDHQIAAGLERRKQSGVHLGAIDAHVGRVMVEEQEGDEVEIANIRGQRIVERPRQADNG